MIAVASLCLGLVYIASVFLYLHIRKRKSRSGAGKDNYAYQQNDQVTFGAGISRGVFGGQTRSSLLNRSSIGGATGGRAGPTGLGLHAEDVVIVKNNPLLKHYPNLGASDNSGFVSDTSNSNSEFDDDFSIEQEGGMGNVSDGRSSNSPISCWVCNVFSSILLTEQDFGHGTLATTWQRHH